jgi:outer membrane protein assembly factor BamB
LLAGTSATAQDYPVMHTRVTTPSSDELAKLNLKLNWRLDLPLDGHKDGIATVQEDGSQVFVQLRSGMVVAVDAKTGFVQWRARPGRPYEMQNPLGANERFVFVLNGTRMYAFDRYAGTAEFVQDLPSAPSAQAVADDERVYLSLGNNRLMAYYLPQIPPPGALPAPVTQPGPPPASTVTYVPPKRSLETDFKADVFRPGQTPSLTNVTSLRPPYKTYGQDVSPSLNIVNTLHPTYVPSKTGSGLDPKYRLDNGSDTPSVAIAPSLAFLGDLRFDRLKLKPLRPAWDFQGNLRLDEAPLITAERLLLTTTTRTVFLLEKENRKVISEFQADTTLSAAPGQYGEIGYLPTEDSTLYAVNIVLARVLWRFNAGGTLDRKPLVTDTEVFTSGARSKVARLNRDNGDPLWQSDVATRVLAVNPKFVYGLDRMGKLVLLDRRAGGFVESFDTSAFNFPVTNEVSDRLYLASQDGALLSLRDRDYPEPVLLHPNEPKLIAPKKKK